MLGAVLGEEKTTGKKARKGREIEQADWISKGKGGRFDTEERERGWHRRLPDSSISRKEPDLNVEEIDSEQTSPCAGTK